MSDIIHMRVVSGTLDMMPSWFDMWHVGGIWHFGHDFMLLTFISLLIRTRCFVRVLHYPCPRVLSIVLMHSLIFHIVHAHTFFGVCCCPIHLMCWWFLAHRTGCHVFLTCYMCVAFDPSDMISCYWHVHHLWSERIRPDQTRPDLTKPDPITSDRIRPDQTWPDQTWSHRIGLDQTKPDQTRLDHIRSDQTWPDLTGPDPITSDRTRPDQTRPDQTRPDPITSNHIRPYQTW
jgi:hypothetical protein